MAKCTRTRINRRKICAGDLRHRITLLRRELQEAGVDDNEPQQVFTTLLSAKAGVRTFNGFSGTPLFDGVSVEERPTHSFIMRRNSITENVDDGNTFILLDGRYFRVIRRTIVDEDRYYVDISARERGDITRSANEA